MICFLPVVGENQVLRSAQHDKLGGFPLSILVWLTSLRMIERIGSVFLVAAGLFLMAQKPAATNPVEAARLNNLGLAYMNQQLFDKALKEFQDAAALDPTLKIARLNQGIALL